MKIQKLIPVSKQLLKMGIVYNTKM